MKYQKKKKKGEPQQESKGKGKRVWETTKKRRPQQNSPSIQEIQVRNPSPPSLTMHNQLLQHRRPLHPPLYQHWTQSSSSCTTSCSQQNPVGPSTVALAAVTLPFSSPRHVHVPHWLKTPVLTMNCQLDRQHLLIPRAFPP